MKKRVLAFLLCFGCIGLSSAVSYAEDNSIAEIENAGDAVVFGDWYENEYLDEFGDSTGQIYCASICQGSFDNTATNGDVLLTVAFYEPRSKSLSFRLLEYGNKKATYSDNAEIQLKYKIDKKTGECSLRSSAPNGDLKLDDKESEPLINALISSEDIKIVIYIDNSKYTFSINANGFNDALSDVEKKVEEIGIAGVYYEIAGERSDYYEIIPEDETSGILNYHSEHDDEITLDYSYDPESHRLTFDSDDLLEYNGAIELLMIDDYCVIKENDYEGTIPDKDAFDAVVSKIVTDPNSKHALTITFHKDLSWESVTVNYDGDQETHEEGSYIRDGHLLYMIYGKGFTRTWFINDGTLYPATKGWRVYIR